MKLKKRLLNITLLISLTCLFLVPSKVNAQSMPIDMQLYSVLQYVPYVGECFGNTITKRYIGPLRTPSGYKEVVTELRVPAYDFHLKEFTGNFVVVYGYYDKYDNLQIPIDHNNLPKSELQIEYGQFGPCSIH